jgi:hypothetical protein
MAEKTVITTPKAPTKKKVKKGNAYVCEICGLAYKETEWAEKCQKWCQERQSCNIEITTHAVDLQPESRTKWVKRGR